jgi:hypothetical protein
MDEIEKLIEKLETLHKIFGIGGAIFVLFIVIAFIILWKFLIIRTEKIAEAITEKNLQKFQAVLDKELVKFSTKHQKQIDAVQDFYQSFQELQYFINYINKGEKFTAQMNPDEEVKYLTTYRLEFIRSYNRNKILLPENLNIKIESLLPEIDTFITDYIGGLIPVRSQDSMSDDESDEFQIAGIWPMGKLEPTLEKMSEINKGIEQEFRKIYGTDEK